MEMKKHTMKIFLALSVLLLASLACSIGGLTIQGDVATLEIKLREDQILSMLESIPSQAGGYVDTDLLQKLDSVDFHEGYVSVYGSITTPEGNTVNGNFDLSLSAQDGILQAEIISINVPGMEISDTRVQQANEVIARELTRIVTESNGDVSFQRAEVHEDALYLTVQVQTR